MIELAIITDIKVSLIVINKNKDTVNVVNSVGRNAYFDCQKAKCGYKWKCHLNDDLIYEIFETTEEHNHDSITERKTGLTSRQKEIVIRRINGLEAVNAEARLQAFRNEGIRSLPTTLQVRNSVYQQKQKSGVAHGKLSFMDIDKMVERVGGEPAIVDFKYKIDARNPKKNRFFTNYDMSRFNGPTSITKSFLN
uniref:FLYWCH-type domain-containing protein n=1 Tax=Panagrolaimus davidi TaxID=227884 RepID=A0A914QQM2_9BILA